MKFNNVNDFFNFGSGIVTLCGSTRFFEQCMEANRILTFKGWVVLACGSWGHSYHKNRDSSNDDFAKVKKLHFQKITMSHAIVVVVGDKNGKSKYYGESTKAEITYAKYRNIPVFFFDGQEFTGYDFKSIPKELEDTSLIDNWIEQGNTLGF